MKILLLNATDEIGGAANAALQLTKSLIEYGINAHLGVMTKTSAYDFVFEVPKSKQMPRLLRSLKDKLKKLFIKIFPCFKFVTTNPIIHSENKKSIIDIRWINKSDYDLIHLHWIGNNMISIKDLSKINKPMLWTMHDTWPFCGAEHYPNILENDTRYIEGYTSKNKPKTTKGPDICRKTWKQKEKYLKNKEIYFISPSKWEMNCLKNSALFKENECKVIPNVIDRNIFYPKDSKEIRKLLNIPSEKKVIGFGAAYEINNIKSVKGGYYLLEALKLLKNKDDYFLVIFGPANKNFIIQTGINCFSAGYISNHTLLSLIYNCLDVFVCPSIIENLPYTILESICSGTPVTAFKAGGNPDIIEHQYNGYLATPYDSSDLARGIDYCMENKSILSKNCLIKADKDFDKEDIINEHIKYYNESLNRKRKQQ